MAATILVVEDDPAIRELLIEELSFHGYQVAACCRGDEAVGMCLELQPDLVILDLMLPGKSGLDVCRNVRAEGFVAPIVLLTARGTDADKITGLEAGANDYITKPFSVSVLVARVRSQLREKRRSGGNQAVVNLSGLRINLESYRAERGEQSVELTRKEVQILRMLAEDPQRVVARRRFLDELWPDTYVTERTIDTHVASLRKKLSKLRPGVSFVQSVRGVGYRMNPDAEP